MDTGTEPQLLDQLIERIKGMTPEQRAEHEATVTAALAGMKFIPSPGPQTLAYHSKADILLYGGEAGGGKSALLNGLALTAHKRSLIMRRQYTDLSGLTEEILKFNGTRQGYNGSIPPTLRTSDGRLVEFGAAQRPGDEEAWMGRPHDLIGIDEAWQMLKTQIRFLIGWLRSTDQEQRCRVVLATNPPLTAEGEWIVEMFAPWLDPGHHNPAKQGELRWYVTDDEGKDVEVRDSLPKVLDRTANEWRDATPEEIAARASLKPMSRTFIRASVNDNPFLAKTDYAAKLDSLPPAIRASVRDGNFMAARTDDDWQVIPSDWVRQAQARWTIRPPEGVPMQAIGCDVTGGGSDNNILAPRYDGWYMPLKVIPGKLTPHGDGIGGEILKIRVDNAEVAIDMDGGYGNLPFKELKNNGIDVVAYKGSEASTRRSNDGIYGFVNKRSETHWRMREALDPNQPGGSIVCLPPDPVLAADLCAARYKPVNHKGKTCIQVEPKDDIKTRLGRSPDRGDAVQIANVVGKKSMNYQGGNMSGQNSGRALKVNMGHSSQRRGH